MVSVVVPEPVIAPEPVALKRPLLSLSTTVIVSFAIDASPSTMLMPEIAVVTPC